MSEATRPSRIAATTSTEEIVPAQTTCAVSQRIFGEDEVDATALDRQHDSVDNCSEPKPILARGNRRKEWKSDVLFGLLPALVLVLSLAAAYVRFMDASSQEDQHARNQSVQAAVDGITAILSYRADTAEAELTAAQDRLTGAFRNSYASLIHDVVVPGAKQKQISSQAKVPAAASLSASPQHAVVLAFVNQSITMGRDTPTETTSSVRVTLVKTNGRWLISAFDPI